MHSDDASIFTDWFVCWVFSKHKDFDGHHMYLVPNAYGFGVNANCLPGIPIGQFILDAIDKFLEKNPDL